MAQDLKIVRFAREFTRQTDVTPYASQDAILPSSSGTTLDALSPISQDYRTTDGLIIGASYQVKSYKVTKSTNTTTNATMDMYLFTSGVIVSAQDNQPYVLDYNQKNSRIGKIALTFATAGSTSTCAEASGSDVNLCFVATTTSLCPQLVATAAYTPGASEKFYIELELLKIS